MVARCTLFTQKRKMIKSSVISLFLDLVSIPSPSGKEKAVGKYIQDYLKKNGITAVFDKTGVLNDSNSGNLVATLPGDPTVPSILFVTHMDTVETGEKVIKPIINKGKIFTDGSTILGADNKASVTSLLETLVEVHTWENHPTIYAVFSTREEKGTMGASMLMLNEKVDYVFVVDGIGPVGTVVHKALGHLPFTVIIHGKAAHAAIEPEKGVNALNVAANCLLNLPLGKSTSGSTCNIGKISGGVGTNVVPDSIIMEGEVRAFTQKEIDKNMDNLEKIIKNVCLKYKASYTLSKHPEEGAPIFNTASTNPIISIAGKAAMNAGLQYSIEIGSFTCEANFFSAKGYPVVSICRGGKMPHSTEESTTVGEIKKLKTLLKNLIRVCINP